MNIGAYAVGNFMTSCSVTAHRGLKSQTDAITGADIRKISNDSPSFENSHNKVGSIDEQTEINEYNGAPDRWTNERLYTNDENTLEGYKVNKDAISRVKEQLEAEGIDADRRTPTHEITDEQMEWLGSRYDLDFLSACSYTHAEYGNFMLDLAYLNVFSFDEVENMFGVMPFNANHKGYLYKLDTGDGLSGYVDPFVGVGNYVDQDDLYTQLIMEYLKIKCTGRTEKEYEQMTEDFAAQRVERMSVIRDFFALVSSNKANNMDGAKPNIENISEKLKEDFGGLM